MIGPAERCVNKYRRNVVSGCSTSVTHKWFRGRKMSKMPPKAELR
jgi:hypothetical protein